MSWMVIKVMAMVAIKDGDQGGGDDCNLDIAGRVIKLMVMVVKSTKSLIVILMSRIVTKVLVMIVTLCQDESRDTVQK